MAIRSRVNAAAAPKPVSRALFDGRGVKKTTEDSFSFFGVILKAFYLKQFLVQNDPQDPDGAFLDSLNHRSSFRSSTPIQAVNKPVEASKNGSNTKTLLWYFALALVYTIIIIFIVEYFELAAHFKGLELQKKMADGIRRYYQ